MIKMSITGIILFITLMMGCKMPLDDLEPDPSVQPNREELNIILETNRIRTDPQGYAAGLRAELEANRDFWNWLWPSRIGQYETAIATLESTAPRHPLSFDEGLLLAARDHAQDMIDSDMTGHIGSDGSTLSDRMQRYGNYSGGLRGENFAGYANAGTGAEMVLLWVLSPPHLMNLLNTRYTLIGAAHTPGHPRFGWIGVQKFAERRN